MYTFILIDDSESPAVSGSKVLPVVAGGGGGVR